MLINFFSSMSHNKLHSEVERDEEKPEGYFVRVIASDRYPVLMEIRTDADWDALESVMRAYREAWKMKEKK